MCGEECSVGGEHLEHSQRPETEQEGHFRSRKGALWLVKSEHSREEQISAVMESRLGRHVRSWKHCSSYEGIGSHGEFEVTEWRHVMHVFYLVYPKLDSSFYVAEKDTKHLIILPPLPECRVCQRVLPHSAYAVSGIELRASGGVGKYSAHGTAF